MTPASDCGPVVVDTDVFSAGLASRQRSCLVRRYAPILAGRPAFLSFQTVMELRFGALHGGWGSARLLRLETMIQRAEIVHTGADLIAVCAELRSECVSAGHALGQSEHNADRWIAATAIRLGVPLVSNDRIFRDVPGLTLETAFDED